MTRRRCGALLVLTVAGGALALSSPSFVRRLRIEEQLARARSAATVEERRAAYRWLLDAAPGAVIDDLVTRPSGRVQVLTGDYIRAVPAGAPPAPIAVTPSVHDLYRFEDLDGRVQAAWSAACLADAALALRTAEAVAADLRGDRHDVGACFGRTLLDSDPGFRRMAFEWLVAHEGFDPTHDWRAPTVGELLTRRPVRPPPPDDPASLRDERVRRWLDERRRRPAATGGR